MNKALLVGTVVASILYGTFFVGLLLLFQGSLRAIYRQNAARHRLRVEKKHAQSMDPLVRHLYFLLGATLNRPPGPKLFLSWCVSIFSLLFLVSLRSFHPLTAMGIGLGAASVPYLLLRIRLETRRKKGSLEGEKVVSELLRQYRISGKNIYEALERLVPEIRDCKICCRLLHRVLLRLRNTGDPMEVREAAAMLSYGVGTNWSHMLSGCIRLAAERGFDVSLGLEDIMLQMRQARGRAEERKRMNSEAMRLTLFMVPLLYSATVLLSVYYLEVPLLRFVRNQMGTPEGMLMFLFIIVLFLLNLALLEVVNNQKLDY